MKKTVYLLILCLIAGAGLFFHSEITSVCKKQYSRIRFINQLSRYDFPAENNGWTKYGEPLYGSKQTKSVFDPFVFMEDETFVMILSERKNKSLVRLESADGIRWSAPQTILEPVEDTWEHLVNRATIVKDSIYHLFYTGQSPDVSKIGHATSTDGISFTRDPMNPVLAPTEQEEGESVMNPCVVYNKNKGCFQMWYAAGENYEPDVIFYAESKDGQTWTKRKQPVLTKLSEHEWEKAKVGGCDVKISEDGQYLMYYIGYQNEDVARICFATSSDGIVWERTDSNLIIAPTQDGWDSDATYKPSYLEHGGKAYLWYNGRSGRLERIGLATKNL